MRCFMDKESICLRQGRFMMDCSRILLRMVRAPITIRMLLPIILEIGVMILNMVPGYLVHLNSTIKDNGNKASNMAMDIIRIKLVIMSMLVNSIKESNKEKVESFIVMVQYIMVSSVIKCLGELGISNTLTKISILDNLMKEKNMVKEITFLVRVQFLQEYGKTITKFKVN